MKVRALGPLTGASGEREEGEEFTVEKDYGNDLIARGYVEEVVDVATKPSKADQAKE